MHSTFLAQIDIQDHFQPAHDFGTISSLLNIIVPNIFLGAGLILFLGIVFAGLKLLTTNPSAEDMKKTKATLTYTLAGFAIIIFSYLFIKLLGTILKIDFYI